MKERFYQVRGCQSCMKRVDFGCCPACGGTFHGGQIKLDLVIKQRWIELKFNLLKPSTWAGGHWETITEK
jgi:hypothetical protein